jgi:hypothetical protein
MTALTPDVIGGAAAVVGAVLGGAVVVLKKCGLVTFGKPTERRSCPGEVTKICGDHMVMKQDIESIKINSVSRLEKLNQIDTKLDAVSEQVAQISGYLQGRNGFHK